ncbi:MAG: ROK family protein [Prevotella sp.]|nr:ROK family protein [Prevotella sp.]
MGNTSVKNRVVGVDISNQATTVAIVDIRGNIIAEEQFCTADYPDVNDFVSALCEMIMTMAEANGGYELIRSVGISSPSASTLSGSIENAANLHWKGVIPLAAMLRDRLGLAVIVSNDAHTAALGEKAYGIAHGMKDFIVVTLGVGLGSCFFSDNHEHQGHGGYAGELGHCCVVENGRECGCGKKGCLEAYAAAAGIVRTARELMAESDAPSLLRNLEELSPRTITECCDKGDEMAIEVYRRTGHVLGRAIANYVSLVNPEAVILCGGISKAGDWILKPTYEAMEENVYKNLRGKTKLVISLLDNRERDVLGASALAWEVPEYSLFK